jgi:hypothetical protein
MVNAFLDALPGLTATPEVRADVRIGLAAVLALVYSADPHIYLSTGCLHGDHTYCQVEARRYDGSTKTAATCKFCAAPCICPCHREAS